MGVILSEGVTVEQMGLRIMRASRLVMSVASGTLIDGNLLVEEEVVVAMKVIWIVRQEEEVRRNSGKEGRPGMSKDRFDTMLRRPRSRSGSTLSGNLH